MKPQTRKEKEVDALARELGAMDAKHIDRCIRKVTSRPVFSYPLRSGHTCGVCGASFKGEYKRCPHCHARFDKQVSGDRSHYCESFCEGQIERVGDWLVERIALVKAQFQRGRARIVYHAEVLQRWIPYDVFAEGRVDNRKLKGFAVFRANQRNCQLNDLSMYGPMEVRRPWGRERRCSYYGDYCYRHTPHSGYRWKCRIPEGLQRRGLTACLNEPVYMAHLLMTNAHFETLVKAGHEKLWREFLWHNGSERLNNLWPSLKTALRGGLMSRLDDYGNAYEYLDYLQMVREARPESSRTMSVLLPENFRTAFERVRRRIQDARRRKAEAVDNAALAQTRGQIADRLDIRNGAFCLVVLTSVDDFRREGETLHHCVYVNEYYKKPESLILSARRIDAPDRPVETIELRLDDNLRIAQCYGDHNHASPWHQEILQLVESGIPQIRTLTRKAL